MNGNTDVMIANYLTILGNPELSKKMDTSVLLAMQQAVAIYTAKTSKDYVDEYKREQEAKQRTEEVTKLFK